MIEWFRDHKLYGTSKDMLSKALAVASEYEERGHKMTLRQLYYQMVARGFIPNEQAQYKKLGRVLTNAREAGMMSWSILEDLGRNCTHPYVRESQEGVLRGIERDLQLDRWEPLDHYVEVWVEKQALEGIVRRACQPMYTPFMACKGYLSATEAYEAGKRYEAAIARGKQPVLIHLGDHDPSGIHMTQDNRDRVNLFAHSHDVTVRRIALNMDQVEEHNPPPNPAKEDDSRFKGYVAEYGDSSWELDALPPEVLDGLIKDEINRYVDSSVWDDLDEDEERLRKPLAALGRNWDDILEFMEDEGMI